MSLDEEPCSLEVASYTTGSDATVSDVASSLKVLEHFGLGHRAWQRENIA
jgi:hypothetical protein